ncbi:esterase [[Leptolyngbya] sp. PCC 7376]|uniref:alpha/beta hydrolase n=1 Tax=[Leptolyngbya] sp. PCC 7376 TaxID=111781 RepID=UPI00029F1874|nr:alpha/beta hydrolase-fold protein [[Leptolyngbya] sp. PCC 7376]AFY39045.1 esterase [[Leptolyngbya] sp. PCC 7376]
MAEAFERGGQQAWFHDHGHWGVFFHTYDNFQLSGFGEHFDQPRKIHVFIPRDYEVSPDRYSVLYCNDGDDIFFGDGETEQSWQVAEKLSQLYLRDQLKKIIVVAICSGDRHYEYSHIPEDDGGLEEYSRYLAKGLKPFIDENYRTIPHSTVILGASRGGLAAFYTACKHPRQFPQVATLSPSFWLGLDSPSYSMSNLDKAFKIKLQNSALMFALTSTLLEPDLRPKIYLDWGLRDDPGNEYEIRSQCRCMEMIQVLTTEFDYQEDHNLFIVEDPNGSHSINSWGDRLPNILQLFFD